MELLLNEQQLSDFDNNNKYFRPVVLCQRLGMKPIFSLNTHLVHALFGYCSLHLTAA